MIPPPIDDAWVAEDPTLCPVCGRDACEEHLRADRSSPPIPAKPSLTVYRALDLVDQPRPVQIIEGVASEGRLTVIVGPSGEGKTFVVIDATAAVSDGVPWHGRAVRQGSVLYISFEGDALGLRVRALREAGRRIEHLYVVHACDPLSPHVARDSAEQRSIGERALVETIETLATDLQTRGEPPIVLTVIDTVRASLSGSEDSSEHVAAYQRAVRRIMTCVPKAAMILVHHAGWQDGEAPRKRERGSSAWRGNSDAVLYLEAGEYDRTQGTAPLTLRTLKARDEEAAAPLHLIRRRVEFAELVDPTDIRRGPLTSCVISSDSRSREDREADERQDELQNDLRVLRALAATPGIATSQDRLRLALAWRRDAVLAALGRLIQRGWVTPPDRQRQPYVVTPAGQAALSEAVF